VRGILSNPAHSRNFAHSRSFQMGDIFAAVDLTTVGAFVAATGVLVIGITMAFKGISLGKRAVNKA
jgi:hypothetical protein